MSVSYFYVLMRHLRSPGLLLVLLLLSPVTVARASDERAIDAITERLGRICKNRVATAFSAASKADITVNVGATLQDSIDSGEVSLADIRRSGLSFDWKVRRQGTDPHGYCNIEADGTIESFSQW